MTRAHFAEGQVLFREGDPADRVFRLLSGTVHILRELDGDLILLGTVGAGQFVGEMGVVENRPRNATARAASEVEVEILTPTEFLDQIARSPRTARELMQRLSQRLREADDRIVNDERRSGRAHGTRKDADSQTAVASVNNAYLAAKNPWLQRQLHAPLGLGDLPFVVGRGPVARKGLPPLQPDLKLDDTVPFRLSRNHFMIEKRDGNYYVRDLCSRLGTIVNGEPIGDHFRGDDAPLRAGENEVIAGGMNSPFVFSVFIQGGQAAARIARAPVPRLAPVNARGRRHRSEMSYDVIQLGVRPPRSLEPERLRPPPAMTRRDKLRGPLVGVLIAAMLAAPIGYYIAGGGWGTSSEPPPGAQMATGPIIDVPPAATVQQEPWLTTTRDDDGGTSAQSEIASKRTEPLRPATVAMVQQSAGGAQAAPASKGWGPSSEPLPGAQMATGPIIDVPPAATVQQEPWLTTTRDDDGGTLAQSEIASKLTGPLRPARSSEDEAVAMVQPSAADTQAAPASKGTRVLDPEEIKLFMKQGEQFIAAGDVVTARIVFQRAAEAGDANAAMALGATYDPTVLAKLGVVGMSADVEKARSWYQTAEKLGSPEARRRLDVLADH